MKYSMEIKATCIFLLGLTVPLVRAASTSLDIHGTVVATSCSVDSDTQDKLVVLEKTQAHALADAGSGGEWTDFELRLVNCPIDLMEATVTFSGTPDDNDKDSFKNTGDAENVSLQLAARSDIYGNGSKMKVNINQTAHTAVFPLSARIYSSQGGATAGTFNSVVEVGFTYN